MKFPTTITTRSGRTFNVRPSRMSDSPSALEFINTLAKEQTFIAMQNEQQTLKDEQKYLRSMIKKTKDHEVVQLLALDGDTVIANTSIELGIRVNHHVGEFAIAIALGYRDEGLGSQIMQLLFKYAEDNLLDLRIIHLKLFANNEKAKHLYEKLGFIEYGRLPGGIFYKGEFVDEIMMYKNV